MMRAARPVSFAFLLFSILTLAMTWPLALRPGAGLPNDAGDPALNTWILWWNTQAVPFTARWWNGPAFFPASDVLAYSEHLVGVSLISSPVNWLTGNPQLAYNLAFLLSFPLSGLTACWLGWQLTRRHDAALVGGLAYAFAPYRIAQLSHLQVLSSYWLPLALVGLHKYAEDPRKRWLALYGSAVFLQALCNGYFLLFTPVLIALWALWFLAARQRWRDLRNVGLATALAYLPLVPVLLKYESVHRSLGFVRDVDEISGFSADVAALLVTDRSLALWGWLRLFPRAEGELFPGLTVVILVIAALVISRRPAAGSPRWTRWIRRVAFVALAVYVAVLVARFVDGRSIDKPGAVISLAAAILAATSARFIAALRASSALAFYVIASFFIWILCLGPAPAVFGHRVLYRVAAPYYWLMHLPGFDGVRVPTRFWTMTMLCVSMAAAVSFARLFGGTGRWRRAMPALVALGTVLDGWPAQVTIAHQPQPLAVAPSALEDGPVLELPIGDPFRDVAAMYRGMSHRHPVMNGFSGHAPPFYPMLAYGLDTGSAGVLDYLATFGPLNVVIPDGPRAAEFQQLLDAQPGATRAFGGPGMTRYRVPRRAVRPQPPGPALGPAVPIAGFSANAERERLGLLTDGDLGARWHTGPQRPRHRLTVDLGVEREIAAIVLALGRFTMDFPRRLLVEASSEGNRWQVVWSGATVAEALRAAIAEPRVVPLSLTLLPPVRARYLRLRLDARDEVFHWSVVELRVHAPAANP